MAVRTWRVSEAETGLRLDVFLCRQVEHLSRTHAHRMIKAGAVDVGGKTGCKPGLALKAGDQVVQSAAEYRDKLDLPDPTSASAAPRPL